MNNTTTIDTTPKQQIMDWAARHGVTMTTEFIPLSQSRNKAEKSPTLNWRVTLRKQIGGIGSEMGPVKQYDIITTDYSAGCAHCPSYKFTYEGGSTHRNNQRDQNTAWECENGLQVRKDKHTPEMRAGKTIPLIPDLADVLYSLSMDADVLDSGSFENWASELGYDTDSRKAESIYRACLDIALKMRAALGDSALQELRDACQDY
jgi:hypothetical protein